MPETQTATQTSEQTTAPAATLATLPTQQTATPEAIPAWSAAAHLSPVAVFQADRVDICTNYQLAAVDRTVATGHLEAALQHLRAAADRLGKEDWGRVANTIDAARNELNRIARRV